MWNPWGNDYVCIPTIKIIKIITIGVESCYT